MGSVMHLHPSSPLNQSTSAKSNENKHSSGNLTQQNIPRYRGLLETTDGGGGGGFIASRSTSMPTANSSSSSSSGTLEWLCNISRYHICFSSVCNSGIYSRTIVLRGRKVQH